MYPLHDISIHKNYLCKISDRKFYYRIPHRVYRSRHMRGGFHLKKRKVNNCYNKNNFLQNIVQTIFVV